MGPCKSVKPVFYFQKSIKKILQFMGPCKSFAMPGSGPPGVGDGCRIQLKINPDDKVYWIYLNISHDKVKINLNIHPGQVAAQDSGLYTFDTKTHPFSISLALSKILRQSQEGNPVR